MMAVLMNKTTGQILIPQLHTASNFWSRGIGLLRHKTLPMDEALWIHRCNDVHTFFMKFSIDCVFVDKTLKVTKIFKDVKPGRLILPVRGASSVFEMASGCVDKMGINVGDQLHVGS